MMKSSKIFRAMIMFSLCIRLIAQEGRPTQSDAGIILPHHVKQISENRFQSSRSYDDTKRDFKELLAKIKSIRLLGDEINLPNVRAIFYQNLDPMAEFYTINIYLNEQNGLTEIFFVKNPTKKKP